MTMRIVMVVVTLLTVLVPLTAGGLVWSVTADSGTALRIIAVIGAALASLSLFGVVLQLVGHALVKWSER